MSIHGKSHEHDYGWKKKSIIGLDKREKGKSKKNLLNQEPRCQSWAGEMTHSELSGQLNTHTGQLINTT